MADVSTRSQNKSARRTRILVEAADLMASGGMQGLTLRELAAASDVTVPTIYNLIGGRDQIIMELVNDAMDQMDAVLARQPETSGIEYGLAAIESCFDLALSQKTLYRAVFGALFEMEASAVADWMGALFRRGGAVMHVAVLKSIEDRDLRGDLAALPMAHNAFHAFQATLRMWAVGALDTRNSKARARYAYLMSLLADATPKGRRKIRALMADAERTLDR
ncbi:MAG: TetR/AcrR family transcriptional regulator [Pseudomonadota bacterium]